MVDVAPKLLVISMSFHVPAALMPSAADGNGIVEGAGRARSDRLLARSSHSHLRRNEGAPIFPVMQDLLDRMSRCVRRHTDGIAWETPLPRVGLGTVACQSESVATVYKPMACLVLQGAKQVLIGDRVLRYDAASCFVASLELPATGCIVEATPGEPYVVASLALDRGALADLLAELPPAPESPPRGALAGFGVAAVTPELLAAWDRLLELLDTPGDISFLAPVREREVLYRLLQGGHGPMLRQIVAEDSRLSQIRRAIDFIRRNYNSPLPTRTLADIAGMSVPTFHRQFRAATAMSPLQFQKALRLQAARRLLATNADAARAAHAVGYESASQFSREYARAFGAPPSRDAQRLRGELVAAI
ncbi:AraC family transcriptional regulator [Brevundimonas abyssalis]|uniref:AraC family transcriptional regulator n=2 Tax=Brevundimonas TaxID=41275 RepID=UPI001F57F65C|nr:AraC family transcriptional regulator [Brevundimonas abyssalis]